MQEADVHVRGLAAGQGGVVTAAQALELGMSKSGISRRVRAKRWQSLGHALLLVDPGADRFEPDAGPAYWRRVATARR